ncbi:MAG: Ig-like domain-containing protein, partial [Acidobacteriota bacterium]
MRAGRGSRDYSHGAPGTYFQLDGTGTFGDLLVDGDGTGADDLRPTTLPTIGRGLVGAVIPAGADVWIEPTDAEARYSVGAVGMWVRIDGSLYRVLDERADRRGLLLEGAAGLVEVGEPYVGFYRFDTVSVRGRAKLIFTDGEEVGAWDVEANSTTTTLDLQPPVIVIDSPTPTDLFASGDIISVSATVTDADAVVSVTFSFDGQTFVDTAAPYEWTVAAPAVDGAGTVELVVEAVDPENNVGRVTRDVQIEGVPAGAPPTASFLCPTPAGSVLAPGATMAVHADAQDDHEVARVEFYFDSELVATVHTPPYQATVTLPAGGADGDIAILEARAYDFGGQTGSATVPVRVVDGTFLTADTVLLAGDTSLDDASVLVGDGATLTVHGSHTFRDLAVLDGGVVTHAGALHSGGLVGHWTFDGADPGTAEVGPDAQLGSTPGADANDPAVECAAGLAPVSGNSCGLELTGDTDDATGHFATVASTPELAMTSRYTVATWVRIDSGGPSLYRPIVFRGADDGATNSNDFEVYTQWDTPYITVVHNRGSGGGSFDYVRFPVPPLDRYFHLAVTFDGSRVAVYYDGVVQANVDRNLTMPKLRTSSSPWLFGKVNNSSFAGAPGSARTLFLDGGLDDVRIYDRTLSAGEVDALRLGNG